MVGQPLRKNGTSPSSLARIAHRLHQLLVKGDVVLGHQHRAEDFLRFHQMVQVSARVGPAGIAGAAAVERFLVFVPDKLDGVCFLPAAERLQAAVAYDAEFYRTRLVARVLDNLKLVEVGKARVA